MNSSCLATWTVDPCQQQLLTEELRGTTWMHTATSRKWRGTTTTHTLRFHTILLETLESHPRRSTDLYSEDEQFYMWNWSGWADSHIKRRSQLICGRGNVCWCLKPWWMFCIPVSITWPFFLCVTTAFSWSLLTCPCRYSCWSCFMTEIWMQCTYMHFWSHLNH
jgi:hypothetical protein